VSNGFSHIDLGKKNKKWRVSVPATLSSGAVLWDLWLHVGIQEIPIGI